MKIGLLFVCHGSTSRSYLEAVNEIIQRCLNKVTSQLGKDFEIVWRVGYLHDVEPRPEDALKELVKERPSIIIVASLFVVPGRHAGEDVPQLVGVKLGETKIVEGVPVKYAGPLWPDDRVVDILTDKILHNLRDFLNRDKKA